MSYEGHSNLLCSEGHLTVLNCYADIPEACWLCKKPFVWREEVDETNGYNPDCPWTFDTPLEEAGWDDVPKEDHYGNKYFNKVVKYRIPQKEEGNI